MLLALVLTAAVAKAVPKTPPPPPPPPAWRAKLEQYATEHLEHPAWGTAHARRDYRLTMELAKASGVEVDEEAVFAASWLHDLGAIEPFAQPGVEHMTRALELIDPILKDAGFPDEKVPLVHTIVSHHMYYSDPKELPPSALYFREADTLDFLGAIGISRIFALTGKHRWAPDINAAEATVRKNLDELPGTLATPQGRLRAADRILEMEAFLKALAAEK